MNEQNEPTSSLLTNDLTDTQVNEPLLPEGDYRVEIVRVEERKSESSGGLYINIQCKTAEPCTAVNGEQKSPGHSLWGRITTSPTEKRTAESISRDLKKFMVSCGVLSGSFAPLEQYAGKIAKLHLGFSKKTPEYPDDRNEVKRWLPS